MGIPTGDVIAASPEVRFYYCLSRLSGGEFLPMCSDEDWSYKGQREAYESMPEISEVELREIFGESPDAKLVVNSPLTMEHYLMTVGPRRAWLWCLHCERVYPMGSYKVVEDLQLCPYAECRGDTILDLRTWATVREVNPHYPEVPMLGVFYPLSS